MSAQPELTRGEVRTLLTHYRLTPTGVVSEETATAWWRELRGYSAGECQAALASMPADRVRQTTAAEIARLIDLARQTPVIGVAPTSARPPRDRAAERAYYAAAGARGIAAVYAAVGWQRNPDHDLARGVTCPFCRARTGQVCGPLSRNRAGKREQRDPITRMHPSRLEAARARQANHATDPIVRGDVASTDLPQGASA